MVNGWLRGKGWSLPPFIAYCYLMRRPDPQWPYEWEDHSHFWIWPGQRNLAAFLIQRKNIISSCLGPCKAMLRIRDILKCIRIRIRESMLYFSKIKSGSGSIPLTNGSGSGSGRPKNMCIRLIRIRIRICNTAAKPATKCRLRTGWGGGDSLSVPPPFKPVLRIHDILVWIRIRGSMPLTNGSRSGSCYFHHWPSRSQQTN